MALITYLTKIHFDFGAIGVIADEMGALGIRRPLVVTDKGVAAAGILETVLAQLPGGSTVTTFDGTPPNPRERDVRGALEVYRSGNCDGVIAVGGGSPIDLGKGVRLLASHDGPLAQYALVEGGVSRIGGNVAPLIAVPTTAGTGSEVGRGAIIVMDDGRKLGVISPHLIPSVAICDPELTIGMPPGLTAATGMDAMAHCIETFIAPAVNPPADAIAADGLHRAAHYIERAVADGTDREARWNMMMASMEGAMAFQKGLGAVHALSHPLGSLTDPILHHGTLNAVLLPPVLRFNRDAIGEKYARLGEIMGLDAGMDPADAIAALNRRIGLPATLSEMGLPTSVLGEMAEQAVKDHCTLSNPRKATADDYRELLNAAMR
ncbi:MAG: iron-containing alcohol dehydrogenase [Rhodospirillales bacterium]|nr:iron-containing alcohol dehydrogenase [Rhodospirillales bacterium]MCW9040766.1 iron-containing alcohol dehydrogenase [Rhodospirillales bacterium]